MARPWAGEPFDGPSCRMAAGPIPRIHKFLAPDSGAPCLAHHCLRSSGLISVKVMRESSSTQMWANSQPTAPARSSVGWVADGAMANPLEPAELLDIDGIHRTA